MWPSYLHSPFGTLIARGRRVLGRKSGFVRRYFTWRRVIVRGCTASKSTQHTCGQLSPERLLMRNGRWDPYYVRSLTRFSDVGLIPPLSEAQDRAITILEETCQKLALHMILEVGDIQFLSNNHILHARTAYKDYAPPAPRRHLMRLWLSTPEDEGGWKLPFHDSKEKKRGGIQVNDTAPVAPHDAE
jgi:hypothetical protein